MKRNITPKTERMGVSLSGPVDKFSSSNYITGLLFDLVEHRTGES